MTIELPSDKSELAEVVQFPTARTKKPKKPLATTKRTRARAAAEPVPLPASEPKGPLFDITTPLEPPSDLFDAPAASKPRPKNTTISPTRPGRSPEEVALGKLANEIAKVYTRRVKLSKVPAVALVVRKALEDDWSSEEIEAALERLADRRMNVSVGTLLYELGAAARSDSRPKFDPKVRRGGKPVETAVYRFYNNEDALLYVGQTPALLERFFEHRDDKPWFQEVDHWSREFHHTREEAEWREDFVISDEWPLYNKKGQPRADGGYRVPSHVAGVLLQVIRYAVSAEVPAARPEQIEAVADFVAEKFDVQHSHKEDRPTHGMWFGTNSAPTESFPMDLDKAREDHGPYRADVDGSLRVRRNPLDRPTEEAS